MTDFLLQFLQLLNHFCVLIHYLHHSLHLTISVNSIIYIHFKKVKFNLETNSTILFPSINIKTIFSNSVINVTITGLINQSIEHVRYHTFYESITIIKKF